MSKTWKPLRYMPGDDVSKAIKLDIFLSTLRHIFLGKAGLAPHHFFLMSPNIPPTKSNYSQDDCSHNENPKLLGNCESFGCAIVKLEQVQPEH